MIPLIVRMSIKEQIMFQDNEIPRICHARWRSRSKHAIILVGHNTPRLEVMPTSQLFIAKHMYSSLIASDSHRTMYVEGGSSPGVVSYLTPIFLQARIRMISAIEPSRMQVGSSRLAEHYLHINGISPEPYGSITSRLIMSEKNKWCHWR